MCYGRKQTVIRSILYEKACVLFNIGALYTQAAFNAINVPVRLPALTRR